MRRAAATLLCAVPAALCGQTATVSVTDCCKGASPPCKSTIAELHYPTSVSLPGTFKSGGSGQLEETLTAPKMELTIKLGGVKVVDKVVDACGHMHIPLPLSLGTVDIDALKSCPAQPGPVTVDITIANNVALPSAVQSHSVTTDVGGNMVLCLDVDITPSSPLAAPRDTCTPPECYKCAGATQQCSQADAGVTLEQCQQLCGGPAPPPPASLYKCTAGQCAASATGVSLADCQQLCKAPAPPAPTPPSGDLYKCTAGQCAASATGVSLPDCQQLCKAPAPPAPTPPSGDLYRCTAGQCAASATGVDLATCQQLCKVPPPPGALYRCAGDQCVVSADGVDLATCQQLCRAPTPPAPAPPAPSKTCFGDGCLKCIEEYVLEILESVELCLTMKIEKCIVRSIQDIENLVEMIIQCSTARGELGGAAPMQRLLARVDAPGSAAGLRAAGQRLRASLGSVISVAL